MNKFLIFFIVTLFVMGCENDSLSKEWVWYHNRKASVTFASLPLYPEKEMPYPEIKVLRDGWKILSQKDDMVSWGWKMEIQASKIPVEKFPEKYKRPEKIGGSWISRATPVFDVKITYTLFDKDGFLVAEDSLSTFLAAGETEIFQKESSMPIDKAMRAARSTFHIRFQKPWSAP